MAELAEKSARPLVSVVLPTYNRERTIARAIRSILSQSYENFELLVVDDGSTDGTEAVVGAIQDPRVHYIRLPQNRGASAARNEGLRRSKGEFVAFQDSDDEWLCDKLEVQVATALEAEEPVAVFHMKVVYGRDEQRVFGPGRVCCVPQLDAKSSHDFVRISHKGNVISPQTLLFSRSVLERVGLFDELLVNSVDWDFSLRLVRNAKVIFIQEPLVMTYIQDDSISTFRRNAIRSQLRILLKLRRQRDVDAKVLSDHFARVGMGLSRLRKRRLAKYALRESLRLSPGRTRNWLRFAANEVGASLALGKKDKRPAQRPRAA
jgi:glycosyltransferase involved in cell wall biosynthesis